jgi:pyrimidine operon attenuation protein/uracil phosphoribosyltransferase
MPLPTANSTSLSTVMIFANALLPHRPATTQLDFSVDGRRVLLIDDVLYTGRTIRAGLDALMAFGRPRSVELMVLIDRRFSRELPIQADYVGRAVDTLNGQRIQVEWLESDGIDRVSITREVP